MENFRRKYRVSNESIEIAESITNEYLTSVFENYWDRKSHRKSSLDLVDIDQSMMNLSNQFVTARHLGFSDFPCLRIANKRVPIDVFQHFQGRYNNSDSIGFNLYDSLKSARDSESFEFLSFESIRPILYDSLTSFLIIRHESLINPKIRLKVFGGSQQKQRFKRIFHQRPRHRRTAEYLNVNVSTLTRGLDVFSSPAYFISWRRFGGPTSPVQGYLAPGTYLFRTSRGSMMQSMHDTFPIDIPPNYNINLSI